ncbi:MAG: pilus assembly PilX N-terminal domain-containing protein [Desulfobacterales bacterium]|nr:MAG: pilus assembly PilX N-terminal domain-containing protein [Desulfobacterales bacterium]
MEPKVSTCNNQQGFAIVVVISVLALITVVGIMATRTTSTELQISTSDEIYKISFYAAEAARAYVLSNNNLYGAANINPGDPVGFPDDSDEAVTQAVKAGSNQYFNGHVEYLNASIPPRGTGFQVGKFKAHIYQMTCTGHGPRNSETTIEAGFFRIGF